MAQSNEQEGDYIPSWAEHNLHQRIKKKETLMAQSNGDDHSCVFCELMGTDKVEAYASGVAMITPLNPVVEGHKLFIHSTHTDGAAHDPHTTGVVFREAAFYAKSLNQDFNLIVNGGKDAGQTVFHLHVHYVPRRANDGLLLPWDGELDRKQHELEALKSIAKDNYAEDLGTYDFDGIAEDVFHRIKELEQS